jgi:4-nitrophenyl phosphatase
MAAHVSDTALAAGLDPLIAVTGCQAEAVHAALDEKPLQLVMNWRWEEGLSTSVRIGLAALPPDVEAVLFLHCDQPLIPPDLLRALVAGFRETGASIVYPVREGQRSTPVLFARSLFSELSDVTGDQGGREVIARHMEEVVTVEVENPDLLADVDTAEDYRRLLKIRESDLESTTPDLCGIQHLIVDMDGVLWRGEEPMPDLQRFFAFLSDHDIGFVLATNNASKRPQQYARKLARLGVSVSVESIVTSAQATAAYLAAREPKGTPVYVIGKKGLRQTLVDEGFTLGEDKVRYVVVGWDPDLTWRMLAKATLLIRGGAGFIGTNPDVTFPSEEGLVPGNGAQLAALQAATGVEPLVVGKPQPWLYQEAMRRLGAKLETTAVIGDRLDTDIAGGLRAGLFTILTLSGITTQADVDGSPVQPDLVCEDIGELMEIWEASSQ